MESSPNNQKLALRIAIIVATILALIIAAFLMFTSTNVREIEQEREGYAKEQARFAEVLKEASDEELFIVLNYAIANHYVPNRDIDPFHDMHVMVGCWQRSLMVYNNLSDRKDLLKKIYPDLKVLDEYVHWGRQSGAPYPNDKVTQTILNNVQQESQKMDGKLRSKYFSTPLMRY